jgi:hypothetical protein
MEKGQAGIDIKEYKDIDKENKRASPTAAQL